MKPILSDVPAPLDVREELFVQGTLRSGLHVDAGQTLWVYGVVRGSVVVEQGGLLVVAGLFAAFVDGNDGVLAVAGALSTPLETVPGRVLLLAGTDATVAGRPVTVTPTGFGPAGGPRRDDPLADRPVLAWTPDTQSVCPVDWNGFAQIARIIRRGPDGATGTPGTPVA